MPRINDYASLAQAIQDFSHRPTIAPFCDYFIQGAEDRIYRKIMELNEGNGIRAMEATLSGTTDPILGTIPVPADFLSLKNATVAVSGGLVTLEGKDANWIYSAFPNRTAQGIPQCIARDGANFIFGPFPDTVYTVSGTYYQRATALSAQNTTTWMVSQIPLTFLSACMIEAAKFLKDTALAQSYMAEFTDRLNDVVDADRAGNYAGGSLVIDTDEPSIGIW